MPPTKAYAQKIFNLLKSHYPKAKMILNWGNNWELLVAIILSAQCTDKKVNEVTAKIFPKYRITNHESRIKNDNQKRGEEQIFRSEQLRQETSVSSKSIRMGKQEKFRSDLSAGNRQDTEGLREIVNFAEVPLAELEQDIKSTGFYHNKAKNIQSAANVVLEKFHGVLPKTMAEMLTIPGVGRKTANVFLGNAYGVYEGIAVDTHVTKQAQALGLTKNTKPEKIEQDLMKLFPKNQWFPLTYLLIEHGRNVRKRASERVVCGKKDCILCK